jgi:DNA polymerase-3 subunit epsilon
MIDAARRVGADSIDELAEAVGVRVTQIATTEAPAVSFAVA